MSKWLVSIPIWLLTISAPLAQAADQPQKYTPPDLPKEQLADLAFDSDSTVYVKAIDGLEVPRMSFFAFRNPNFNLHVAPGIHVLVVQLREDFWSGPSTKTSIRTEAAIRMADLKKGHRYTIVPQYFQNGKEQRFGPWAEAPRNKAANEFAPDNTAKFPWLENVHFEVIDTTDLPDIKFGRETLPDLRWVARDGWQASTPEGIAATLAQIEKDMAKNPQDPWPHRQRGLAELWRADANYDKALAEANKVIELNPQWARGYQERAWILMIKGNLDKEIEDLNKAIEIAPEFTLALEMRADAWQAKGDRDKAIAGLSRAIETDACNILSYYHRGNLWVQMGDYDKALADQNRAIAISPKFAPAYTARAAIWVAKQDFDRAIADYTAAIAIDLQSFAAYTGRGDVLVAKKDFDKAIASYSLALKVDDKNAMIYGRRGILYEQKADYDRAIADYTKALELDPKLLEAYGRRGTAWFRKGDRNSALGDFEAAMRLAPADPMANENMAGYYIQTGNPAQAADYCMKAGESRVARGDLQNAVVDWNMAAKVDPKRAAAFQQRAETYAQLGQIDAAVADYTQALALTPGQARWAQRLAELKSAPRPPAPAQAAVAPTAAPPPPAPPPPAPPASAPARTSAPQATPGKPKFVIQGTLLRYPDRTPVAGVYLMFGVVRASGLFQPVGTPIAKTDSKGQFRLEFAETLNPYPEPADKMFSIVVYGDRSAGAPIGTVAQGAKGRKATARWDLPRESGVLDLDKSGDLFLNGK